MTTIVGRNCKVEVALTFAAVAAFTAVTKANPGVATKTASTVPEAMSARGSVHAASGR